MDEESRCGPIKGDIEKLFQTLQKMGLDLGKILVIVRRCGEQAMIHIGGASISGVNALSVFPTGVDASFVLLRCLVELYPRIYIHKIFFLTVLDGLLRASPSMWC